MSTKRAWIAGIVGLLLLVIGAVFVTLYHRNADLRSTLEFTAGVLGGAGVIFGAVYAFLTAAEARDEARRVRALALIDQLNTRELAKIQVELHEWMKANQDPARMDSELRAKAYFFLGLLEDVALNIRARVADEEVLFRSLRVVIPGTVDFCRPFIDYVKQRDPAGPEGTVYDALLTLAARWSAQDSRQVDTPAEDRVARPLVTSGDGGERAS